MKNNQNNNLPPLIKIIYEEDNKLKPKFILSIIIMFLIINVLINSFNYSYKSLQYFYLFFQIIIYLLIAFILWTEKQNLEDFHLDKIAFVLFLFIRPIMLFIYSKNDIFQIISSIIITFISISFLFKFRSSYNFIPRIQRKTVVWGIIGIFIGIIERLIQDSVVINKIVINQKIVIYIVFIFFYYFSQTVLEEEFIFRGIIWGYLKRIGWKDGGICLFQAIIFWIVHFHHFMIREGDPFGFRFFIGGIILGLLTWITRTITPSIMSHFSYNTSDAVVVYLTKIIK